MRIYIIQYQHGDNTRQSVINNESVCFVTYCRLLKISNDVSIIHVIHLAAAFQNMSDSLYNNIDIGGFEKLHQEAVKSEV